MDICPTTTAAKMLGLTPETLRSWRRRGIGPPYIKQSGSWVRSRCAGVAVEVPGGGSMRVGRGRERWWPDKRHGTIGYPVPELKAFVDARSVPRGKRLLPRPFPGRLPGGRNHTAGQPDTTLHTAPPPLPDVGDDLRLIPAVDAAPMLGLTPETLREWRRRGIGPAYVRLPGGRVRGGKPCDRICYPKAELRAFADAWLVEAARRNQSRQPPQAQEQRDITSRNLH